MNDHDAISALRNAFVEAINREDAEELAAMLTNDAVGIAPNRPAMKGREANSRFHEEGFRSARSTFSVTPEELEIFGDVAIDQFHWTMDSTPRDGGSTAHDEGECIWIVRRQPDGYWKVSRAIWNSDLETPGLWSGAS